MISLGGPQVADPLAQTFVKLLAMRLFYRYELSTWVEVEGWSKARKAQKKEDTWFSFYRTRALTREIAITITERAPHISLSEYDQRDDLKTKLHETGTHACVSAVNQPMPKFVNNGVAHEARVKQMFDWVSLSLTLAGQNKERSQEIKDFLVMLPEHSYSFLAAATRKTILVDLEYLNETNLTS